MMINAQLAASTNEQTERSGELERALAKLMFTEEKLVMGEKEKAQLVLNYQELCKKTDSIKISAEQFDRERSTYRIEVGALKEQIARRDIRVKEQDKQLMKLQ